MASHIAGDLQEVAADIRKSLPGFAAKAKKVVEVNALGSALAGQKDEVIFSANAAALAPRKPSPRVTYEAVQKADAAFKFPRHRRATNIHTHTFHSNFNDTVHSIIDMDDPLDILMYGWGKGLCFKCDHKWGPGQRCGGPKLFRIEETKGDRDPIDNTEDYLRYRPIELNEEIGISPPAINRSPKPMMVKIMVNSHEYIALIDTGSNLNILHPRVAQEVGLTIIKDDPIKVTIADGSEMCSEGSCPEFKFVIQEGQFATPAYIFPLDGCGCDVILGIEWLMGLGQINWDFASLKMELTQGDRKIQIKGMDTEESEAGCSTDEKLLSVFREGVKYGAGIVYDIHSPRVPSTEEIKYGAGIGPGVFDIHSPRVPSTEKIADIINKLLAVLETNSCDPSLWDNPDCGLTTRKCTEVKPALKNKLLRSQLVSAK